MGNRPDCAYFLLLGLCLASFLLAIGGVLTYHLALSSNNTVTSSPTSHSASHSSTSNKDDLVKVDTNLTPKELESPGKETLGKHHENLVYDDKNQSSLLWMWIMGPLCLLLGSIGLLTVSYFALKYDCDYEPEEPNVAFLRLKSELSLNFDPAKGSTYELMRRLPSTSQSHHQVA